MKNIKDIVRDIISKKNVENICPKCGSTLRIQPVETKTKLSTGRIIFIPGNKMVCDTCNYKGKTF
jgi:C4-type Zn-finger protein